MIDAIDDAIPAGCTKIFVASAYTTREGVRLLFDRLRLKLGAQAFAAVPKRLVTTFDHGLTDADAIDDWIAAGGTVRIANSHVIQAANLMPAAAFHPKVYSFRSPAGDWKVVTGSANLTGRGLTVNAEAMMGASVAGVDMTPSMERLREGTVRADAALLAAYRLLKAANPPPANMAPLIAPVPPPPVLAVNGLSTLSDAIALNGVMPGSHQRFWMQTLTMSGGSGSMRNGFRTSEAIFPSV
ncbi:MAG TPA: phospholipase D family protein [Sphingomonas sp.]|nr:phospholipase D family protein [Sphingomonas sp.]